MYISNCSVDNLKIVQLPEGRQGCIFCPGEVPEKLDSINAPTFRFCGVMKYPTTCLGTPNLKGWTVGLALSDTVIKMTKVLIEEAIQMYCKDSGKPGAGADTSADKLAWNYEVKNKPGYRWAWFNYDHSLFPKENHHAWPALYDASEPEDEDGLEKLDPLTGIASNFDGTTMLGIEAQLVLSRLRPDRPNNVYPKFNIGTVFYLGYDMGSDGEDRPTTIVTPNSPFKYKNRRIQRLDEDVNVVGEATGIVNLAE